MKVWIEGVEGASLSGVQVFQTWENLREHWRLNYHPGDDVLHRLDDDARKLMNGTAIFAEIGFYGHRNGETIHHCARLVVVDDWYGSGKKKPAKKPEVRKPDPEPPLEQIKPCPKCGSDKVWTVHPAYDGGAYVACRHCGYGPQRETWAPTDARAIYSWNRLERSN